MSAPGADPRTASPLFWRDEILQVLYWHRGEGFGDTVSARQLSTFLAADPPRLEQELERLVTDGYLARVADAPERRYGFTAFGAREGGRRFADEFAGLTSQGHGDCGPDCPHCEGQDREHCVHCGDADPA